MGPDVVHATRTVVMMSYTYNLPHCSAASDTSGSVLYLAIWQSCKAVVAVVTVLTSQVDSPCQHQQLPESLG